MKRKVNFEFTMANFKTVGDDDEFDTFMEAAGDGMVVIDFYTTWCGPCRTMEPIFSGLAKQYPNVLFLKVDAEKCIETAMNHNIRKIPVFIIYLNKTIVEVLNGVSAGELEAKVKIAEEVFRHTDHTPKTPVPVTDTEQPRPLPQLYQSSAKTISQHHSPNPPPPATPTNANLPGTSSLGIFGPIDAYIAVDKCSVINDLSPTSFQSFAGGKRLVSGKGTGKVLLHYVFTQKMMLRAFVIKASPQSGPKVIRFFVNHPKLLEFSVAAKLAPSQEYTLSRYNLIDERAIELRSASFNKVSSLQIFVTTGQAKDSNRIEIESIQLFGIPNTEDGTVADKYLVSLTSSSPGDNPDKPVGGTTQSQLLLYSSISDAPPAPSGLSPTYQQRHSHAHHRSPPGNQISRQKNDSKSVKNNYSSVTDKYHSSPAPHRHNH